MNNVRILATGRCTPDYILNNQKLSQIVETNDEWIITRTGIKERRISKGENTSYFSWKAGEEAIRKAGISPKDIDIIIVATSTPDSAIPSTACLVQDLLEANNAFAFDISAACTGFIYGLDVGYKMLLAGPHKRALIIGVDVLSKVVNWEDRGTCILFGDGAGAVIIEKTEEKGIYNTYLGSDGSRGKNALVCGDYGIKSPFVKEGREYNPFIKMEGKEIFKFAVRIIPESVNKVLENTNISLDEIKYIIPHQANFRIVDAAAKKLNVDIDKFYLNVDKYGNTSAASIPIALDEIIQKNLVKKGDKIILVGFGGGLTWGAILLEI